jgi:hypothetical protein
VYQNHPQLLRVLVNERHARLREQAAEARLRRQVRRARREGRA